MADPKPGTTLDLVRYLFAWVPAGAAALYLKSHVLTTQGYRIVAQEMGLPHLTSWGRLVLFRGDLALALVIVPLVFLVILRFCPSVLRGTVVALVGLLVLVIVFIQLKAFDAAGGFVSLFFIRQGLSWSHEQPEFTAQYVARTELTGLVAACLLTIAAAAWAFWRERSGLLRRRPSHWPGRFAGLLLGITLLLWLIPVGQTSYQGSALAAAGRTLLVWARPVDPIEQDLSASLPPRPEELTGAAPHLGDAAYFGLARESDVVYFILETAPARVLPIDGPLEDLPNLKRLREHALVLPRHYSTYPYTSFALFSILCSAYPSDRLGPLARPFDRGPIPGTMATLAAIGYRTALYAPNPQRFGGDSAMYAALGIKEQHAPPSGVGAPDAAGAPVWRRTLARDSAAFDLLLRDVRRWIDQDQRYAAVFLPQIGHAPWPDLSPDRSLATPAERARRVIERQDQWIGELVALLERRGRLQRTIIVVVGDHGVRTTKEAGDFSGGKVDDYSFHVPGLIYTPQLGAPRRVEVLTSHIDIGPTVLDLLGAKDGRALEQGSPVWAEGLQDRTTFFLSRYYLGADGYYRRGNVFMWNYLAGTAFFSHYPLAFPDSTALPVESPASHYIESTLRRASLERERVLHDLETGEEQASASPH